MGGTAPPNVTELLPPPRSPSPGQGVVIPFVAAERPAVPASVPELRSMVVRFAGRHGVGPPVLGAIVAAVNEALTNAVRHAYEPAERGTVRIEADLDDGDLEVVVSDEGHGLRDTGSAGLGIGLPLIAQRSSDFGIRERPGGGTEVWMRFVVARPAAVANRGD